MKAAKILGIVLFLFACSKKIESKLEWLDNPQAKITFFSIYGEVSGKGFAKTADFELEDIPLNYQYEIYRNDHKCIDNKITDGIVNSKISEIGSFSFEQGHNKFYALVTTDKLDNNEDPITRCILAGSYYKVNINLTLTPKENAFQLSWTLDNSIVLNAAEFSVDDGPNQTVINNQIFYDYDHNTQYQVKLELTDSEGYKDDVTKNITPNSINQATGILLKKDTNNILAASGFAKTGTLRASGFAVGDRVGLYKNNACTTTISPDTTATSTEHNFNVTFEPTLNSFYVKRYPKGNINNYSCSSVIEYLRGSVTLNLTAIEAGIKADFDTVNATAISFAGQVGSEIISNLSSPYSFTGLNNVNQNITITATDIDGNTDFITKSATPLPLSGATFSLKNPSTEMPFNYNIGFASQIKITITGINVNDTIGVYSNNTCNSAPIRSDEKASANTIDFNINTNNPNVYNFYVKRVSGNAVSCSSGQQYTKASVNFTSTDAEFAIKNDWTVSHTIPGISYKLNIDGGTSITPTGNSHIFTNLTITEHSTQLEARDADNIPLIISSSATPLSEMQKPNASLVRNDGLTTFLSNPGLSTSGKIKIDSNYLTSDTLELYNSSNCLGTAASSKISSTNETFFDVSFSNPINTFSIKRILYFEPTKTSCSSAMTYNKSTFTNLNITTTSTTLTATWDAPTPVINSVSYTINLQPENITSTQTTLSKTYTELTTGEEYTFAVSAVDQDNATVTISDTQETLAASGFVKIYTNGGDNSARALLDPSSDPFANTAARTIKYSYGHGFAAIREDGSIYAWGGLDGDNISEDTPPGNNYVSIASTGRSFAALTNNGSIHSWGAADKGGLGAPNVIGGFKEIASTSAAFAAIEAISGKIQAWGTSDWGVDGAPTNGGYVSIIGNSKAFAAIHSTNPGIKAWGDSTYGGTGAPTTGTFSAIAAASMAFAAIRTSDKAIIAWGRATYGGTSPTGTGYKSITAGSMTFAALTNTGAIKSWGHSSYIGTPPTSGTYTYISAGQEYFAALHSDKSIRVWGNPNNSVVENSPSVTDKSYKAIAAGNYALAAIKESDGSIVTWGSALYGGTGKAPSGTGFVSIIANIGAFAAIKDDGSIVTWGDDYYGGSDPAAIIY